jgi:uncharacterized Zn-binding protein involved in type VI secretion
MIKIIFKSTHLFGFLHLLIISLVITFPTITRAQDVNYTIKVYNSVQEGATHYATDQTQSIAYGNNYFVVIEFDEAQFWRPNNYNSGAILYTVVQFPSKPNDDNPYYEAGLPDSFASLRWGNFPETNIPSWDPNNPAFGVLIVDSRGRDRWYEGRTPKLYPAKVDVDQGAITPYTGPGSETSTTISSNSYYDYRSGPSNENGHAYRKRWIGFMQLDSSGLDKYGGGTIEFSLACNNHISNKKESVTVKDKYESNLHPQYWGEWDDVFACTTRTYLTLNVDATPPTLTSVSLQSNSGSSFVNIGDTVTLSFTADEPISTPSVSIAGNTDSVTIANTSGNNWTAQYTIPIGISDGSIDFTIDFQDLAGNTAAQVSSTTDNTFVAVDSTSPASDNAHPILTVSSTGLSSGGSSNDSPIPLTFTASEAIRDFIAGDVIISGGTISNFTYVNNITYTAMVTPISEGLVTVDIASGVFTDSEGNSNTAATQFSWTYDSTAPTLSVVSIVSGNSDTSLAKVGDAITLSFTSSELTTTPIVTIAGQSAAMTNTLGNEWEATYTLQSADTEGAIGFTVDFDDAAGNTATQVTTTTDSSSVTFDKTAPTVVSIVTDDSDDKVKDEDVVIVTTTFSEAMTASPTISIDLPNGTDISGESMTQSTTADVWYYDWKVEDVVSTGTATITVAGSDLAGNAYAGGDTDTVTIDNTAPTLTITAADTSLIIGETSIVTFTFSEDILGFVDADITLAGGGSLSSISATSSQVFSATLTPPSDTTGTVTLTVGATTYTDIVLNDNTTTATISFTVDTQSPTLSSVSISSSNSDSAKAKIGDTVTLTFTSSEAIQSPTVTIDGNAATISGSGTSWTATYTLVSGDTEGALAFTIDFQDTAGNSGTQVTAVTDSSSVNFDNTAPTVASIVTDDSDDKVKNTDVVIVTTTFSEAMTASPTISIDLPNGTDISGESMTQSTTADVWYYDWTVSDGGDGTATITVAGSDLAGNAYAGGDTDTVTIDNIAPTVASIVTDDSDDNVKNTDVVIVTTTFSEAMTASPTISIDLPNGTDISGESMTQSTTADVWYYDWKVEDVVSTGTATITVAGSDLAGNAYAGGDTDTVTIDNTAPTLTITAADTSLIIGETSIVTFTFSEDILGFVDADITLAGGGSLSSISATSSQVFSATLTPPSDTTGTVTLTVGATTYTDIVLNDNTTTATISFTVDTQSPTLSSVSISSSNSDSAKAKIGDTVTLTFTSSEAIQSPTVTIDGNAATISGSGTSWTATYTLVSGDTEGALAFTIDFQDTAGNSGTQVTAATDGSSATFDETVPTVASIVTDDSDDKVKDTDVVRVTTTFSEAMTSAPTISIDLPNGTDISAASMTQSTTADVWYYDWTVDDSDGGDGTATITVAGSDLAGNAYAGGNTDTVTIDNTAPTLTITAADTSLIIAETSVVTFTFSKDVLGFVDADITLAGGGSLSSISATSSQVFSATLTPPSDTTGTVTLTVGATTYTDIVLNDNTTTATISFTVDTQSPTLSSVSISSSNSDSAKAKIGDTVTLTFTSSEAIQSPTVTIDGNAATISGSGTSWTATYTLVSGDTEGALAFTIDFQDTAGNSGTQVTAVTDSSSVNFDNTAPTVASIVTDDSDDKVKDTDVVRVTTTFSEAMTSAPTISIDLPNGTDISAASMTQSTTADVWYYDWTVDDSDGGDGTATITVAGSDLAGNAYAGGNTDTVTIDNTAPTLTITAADTSLIIAETSDCHLSLFQRIY